MFDPVYYVYEPKSGYTKFEHESYDSAKAEAERLTRKQPEDTFYILKKLAECRVSRVEWEYLNGYEAE